MIRHSWILGGLCAVLLGAGGAEAASAPLVSPRTQVTLESENRTVQAGKPFWTALHIHLQPGWHTYWKNPGDSGTVPTLSWTLPNGFQAGPLTFPAPERLTLGPLVDYGYNADAYYLVRVTPPAAFSGNSTAILMLKAQWLVCKDICVPEKGEFSLPLPGGDAPMEKSDEAEAVHAAVQRVPESMPTPVSFTLDGNRITFDAPLPQAAAGEEAEFFPNEDGFVANAGDPKAEVTAGHVAFSILKSDNPPPAETQGVIALRRADRVTQAYEIHLQSSDKAGVGAGKAMGSGTAPATLNATSAPNALASVPPVAPKTGGIGSMLWLAFLGGLILNAMPCVFPILSLKALAIAKKARAEPKAVRGQGMAYASGVIVSFWVLATVIVVVQQSGHAVGWGYQMQQPIYVASLALLMFLVGLNLSGYFELPLLFGNVGAGAAAKESASGSFVTGVLAVLVATPCTAPYMGPAIAYALGERPWVVLAIFTALGLGLAFPFLVISFVPAFARALPKPGVWMLYFKQLVAFPIYLTVVWLLWVLAREAGPDAVAMLLAALVLATFGLWLGGTRMRFARRLATLLALPGVFMLLGLVGSMAPMETMKPTPFSAARLDGLRAHNHAVFVDATADWCITCKVNERLALSSPAIKAVFRAHNVTYMVADWTHDDAEITTFLQSFGRSGVPLYVYYPANHGAPQVLPQVLSESLVRKTLVP